MFFISLSRTKKGRSITLFKEYVETGGSHLENGVKNLKSDVAGRDSGGVRDELLAFAVFLNMSRSSPSLLSDYLDYQCASSGVNISLDED